MGVNLYAMQSDLISSFYLIKTTTKSKFRRKMKNPVLKDVNLYAMMHGTKSRTRHDRIVHKRTLRECRGRNEFQAQI